MSDSSGSDNEINYTRDDGAVREDLEPTVPAVRKIRPRSPSTNLSMRRLRRSVNSQRVVAAIILLVLVAILVAIVLHTLPPNLRYTKVVTGNLTVSFPTTGVLQSSVYGANFVEPGTLAEIDVTVGETVTEGEVLAKLNTKLLQDAVNSAQAQVDAAQGQVSDAETTLSTVMQQSSANLAVALDTEQSAIAACESDATCIQNAQDAYSAAQSGAAAANQAAQSTVDDAQANLTTAESELQQAQDAQASATLKASHSGTVSSISAAVGDTVGGPGSTFITLVDLAEIQVKATVNVAQVSRITTTTVFRLVVPSVGKQQFGGTLDGISPVGERIDGVLTYPLLIQVDMLSTNGAFLLPGMSANVQVITEQRTGVLLIPASAVNFAQAAGNPHFGGFLTHNQVANAQRQARQLLVGLQNSGSVTSADNPTPSYVLEFGKGKWTLKPVVLGLTDGHVYEVLAGLNVGEKVVSSEVGGAVTVPTPTLPVTS